MAETVKSENGLQHADLSSQPQVIGLGAQITANKAPSFSLKSVFRVERQPGQRQKPLRSLEDRPKSSQDEQAAFDTK